MVDDFILGDAALHSRLRLATCILAELTRRGPRGMTTTALEEAMEHPAKELERLCRSLMQDGLLQLDKESGNWTLAAAPEAITLEEIFHWALKAAGPRRPPAARDERLSQEVDLLVTQAMMDIHQSISQHLRRFSLDRLKISAAASLPPLRTNFSSFCTDEEMFTLH